MWYSYHRSELMNKNKKIIIWVVVGVVITAIAVFLVYYFSNYKTLICRCYEGDVILIYDNKNVVNFGTTKNMSFDIDAQNIYVEKIGIEAYIKSFIDNYENSFGGKCREI